MHVSCHIRFRSPLSPVACPPPTLSPPPPQPTSLREREVPLARGETSPWSVVMRHAACLLVAVWSPAMAVAHEGHDHPPKAAQPAEVYKPGLLPDRIVLTWADDPARTQAVTWRTSTEVKKAMAEIAVAEAGPGFPKNAKAVAAATEALTTDLGPAHYHSVHVDGPTLRYEARTAIGEVYDAFVLRKRPGDINQMVDEAPRSPERVRADLPRTTTR